MRCCAARPVQLPQRRNTMNTGRCSVQFRTATPVAWAGGVGGGGVLRVVGAFLNALFHSEHFEYERNRACTACSFLVRVLRIFGRFSGWQGCSG